LRVEVEESDGFTGLGRRHGDVEGEGGFPGPALLGEEADDAHGRHHAQQFPIRLRR
jgi:hypothetical protein